MKRNKKGFTIIELVVVIAVIAILAAVLIPTFSSIIKRANTSADEQAVYQMNTALAIYTAENGAPKDYFEVKQALDKNGINADNLVPFSKGYAFYWDKTENKILLVKEDASVPNDAVVLNANASENFAAAKVGDTTYNSLQDALTNAGDNATIVLENDIKIDETLVFNSGKDVTLDLNGKTIYNTEEVWRKKYVTINYYDVTNKTTKSREIGVDAVIFVYSGHLTLKGNGTVRALANDEYAVSVTNGATLTIEDGTYIGNVHAAYSSAGVINIKGGTFSIQQLQENGYKNGDNKAGYGMIVNCKSDTFATGNAFQEGCSNIIITGGTFQEFDPSNESVNTLKTSTILSDDYKSIPSTASFGGVEYTYYTVVKKTN